MRWDALVIVAVLGISSSACVTTRTGNVNEPWGKSERAALHTQMGVNYLQQGQVEVALEELELALRIQPNSSAANLAMAKLKLQLDDPRAAGTHFARAVRYDRDNVAAKNDYGFFLCSHGETREGLEQLTAALNHPLNQNQYISLFGAAECERREGNFDQAVKYYELALQLQPDLRPALLQLAYINFDRDQHLKTRAFLERFFQDQFYTSESLFLAVRNELKLDRRDLASEYARLLRTRFPGSRWIDDLRPLFQELTG